MLTNASTPPEAPPSSPATDHERTQLAKGQENKNWEPPHYSESRSVVLNPSDLRRNYCVAFDSDAPEADAYRILRTRIMHRCDLSYSNTLMVTSALPGEGKTLTAINLALTFAKQFNQTVLLVDCDLRRQMVHEVLSYKSDKGLVNYLIDDEPMSELIVWPGIEKLTIVSGGRAIKDSSELLGSPAMKGLIDEMKHRYPDRLVIFDAPPILAGADTLAFAPLVDSILVVVRAEHTSGKDVERAVGLLPQEKIIGTVFNRGKARQNSRYAASYGMSGENS